MKGAFFWLKEKKKLFTLGLYLLLAPALFNWWLAKNTVVFFLAFLLNVYLLCTEYLLKRYSILLQKEDILKMLQKTPAIDIRLVRLLVH